MKLPQRRRHLMTEHVLDVVARQAVAHLEAKGKT
jgi:hypothetical protein